MGQFLDLTGQRFGRLTVLARAQDKVRANGRPMVTWKCQCDCGEYAYISRLDLRSGSTKSCGCLHNDNNRILVRNPGGGRIIHGDSNSRLYRVWHSMKRRCFSPKDMHYHNYGARGISVCREWLEYKVFKNWALSNGYDSNAKYGECTIDRIDVNGNYCPENCRWVDMKTQAGNKRIK